MRKPIPVLSLMACFCLLSACDASNVPAVIDASELSVAELPVINGTEVTGDGHLSTVALAMISNGSMIGAFCTGTLISPGYVLTAGHCVAKCENDPNNKYENRKDIYVLVAQDVKDHIELYAIDAFIVHPEFTCSPDLSHDIALLRLKERVPMSVAIPTPPLVPALALTPDEVDSPKGVEVTSVGFGKTDAIDAGSTGIKFEATRRAYAVCPSSGEKSAKCGDSKYTQADGLLYMEAEKASVCEGDSGGPNFVLRDGRAYVAGVTSYGYSDCKKINGMTLVTDYYDFLKKNVDILPASAPENCTNGADDNGDGLEDCADPHCYDDHACRREDCSNKKDDNGDGYIDCDDPMCAKDEHCVGGQEICDDGIDNDENGLTDCYDPVCAGAKNCRSEICDDGADNDDNGLIDCDDFACAGNVRCQAEICNDGVDNNANGKADCHDPACAGDRRCQPEICDDGIDNNDNGRTDCEETSCAGEQICRLEVCNDRQDNNGDGLVDCDDPQCANSPFCQPEICNDAMDNDGDGLVDCHDPECADVCGESSGCSISSGSPSPSPSWMLLFSALSLGLLGRKKRDRRG